MKDYQYVCFDLDGTLLESGEGIKSSLLSVFKDYNLDLEKIGDLDKFIGPPLQDSFVNYCGFSKDEVNKVIEDFRVYYFSDGQYKMTLYPGARELLGDLHSKGRNVILVTSKVKTVTEKVLERFGIKQYFRYIAASNPDNTMSDKKELLSSVIDELNITDKSKMIMIGDRLYDMVGAKGVGIDSIGVLYGYGSYEELDAAGAKYFAESIDDLRILLKCRD